jgi:hypothetical protein
MIDERKECRERKSWWALMTHSLTEPVALCVR